MKFFTWLSRILVGVLFIISGLIKANDPLGFSYKLVEYFEVFHLPHFFNDLALATAILICVLEIVLGFCVLFGAKMIFTSWMLLLLIVFFTFLTFYSAYFNKVTDCGCFGDAVKLTPWQSFTKDLVLLIFILIIFIRRKHIRPVLKSKSFEWMVLIGSAVASTAFALYCLWYLPVIDFRPYKVGNNIPELMKVPPGAPQDVYEIRLVYKNQKTGEVKEFDQKNYPWQDTTWKWVETKNTLVKEGVKPKIHDFSIVDADGNDVTEDFLNDPEPIFMLISYDIRKTNKDAHVKFNSFVDKAYKNGINVVGLTASPASLVDEHKHEVQSMLDYYFMDEITLKTIIRSNPGLVLLKQGTVIGQWSHREFPSFEEAQRLAKK